MTNRVNEDYTKMIDGEASRLSNEYGFLTQGLTEAYDPIVPGLYLGKNGDLWILSDELEGVPVYENKTRTWMTDQETYRGLPVTSAPYLRINPSPYGMGPYARPVVLRNSPTVMSDDSDDDSANSKREIEQTLRGMSRSLALRQYSKHMEESSGEDGNMEDNQKVDKNNERNGGQYFYVFNDKGVVADLPEGSTVLDYAYNNAEGSPGARTISAIVNGKMTALNTVLHSGDTIKLIVSDSKRPVPSEAWLDFVQTDSAWMVIKSELADAEQGDLNRSGDEPQFIYSTAQAVRFLSRQALDGSSGFTGETERILEAVEWIRDHAEDLVHGNNLAEESLEDIKNTCENYEGIINDLIDSDPGSHKIDDYYAYKCVVNSLVAHDFMRELDGEVIGGIDWYAENELSDGGEDADSSEDSGDQKGLEKAIRFISNLSVDVRLVGGVSSDEDADAVLQQLRESAATIGLNVDGIASNDQYSRDAILSEVDSVMSATDDIADGWDQENDHNGGTRACKAGGDCPLGHHSGTSTKILLSTLARDFITSIDGEVVGGLEAYAGPPDAGPSSV
jgi:hypothetical protein